MDRSNDPRNFYANPSVEQIIAQQGKVPIADPTILLGDVWPEDEPVERFLAVLHEWRGHNRANRHA